MVNSEEEQHYIYCLYTTNYGFVPLEISADS